MSLKSSPLKGLVVVMLAGLSMLSLQSCSIGPRVATETLIVQPGAPVQIVQTLRASCRILGSDKIGDIDITGWVAIRPDDFNAWMQDYLALQQTMKDLTEKRSIQ